MSGAPDPRGRAAPVAQIAWRCDPCCSASTLLIRPQHWTVPLSVTAQVKPLPAATSATDPRVSGTAVAAGKSASVVVNCEPEDEAHEIRSTIVPGLEIRTIAGRTQS